MKTIIERAAEGLCACHRIPEFPYIRFTLWNERMTQIMGYTMDEINRIGWYQTLYPDPETRKRAIERMNQMRVGVDLHNEEWTITRSDGETRVLNISTSLFENDDGENQVLALMYDQTEKKRAEEALKNAHEELERKVAERTAELRIANERLQESQEKLELSEKSLKSILETSPDIIYRLDAAGRIIFINDAVREYGYLPEELIGLEILELVHPEDRERAFYNVKERRTGDRKTKYCEVRLLVKGHHHPIHFELKSIKIENHVPFLINAEGIYRSEKPQPEHFIGTQGIARDISERKLMEKALMESESQKRAILEGITTNLAFVNENLDILWVNKAAAVSANKKPEEMIGYKCYELWGPNKPCDSCPTVKAFKTLKTEEAIIHTPDGRIWEEKGEPIFDDHGNLIGVLEIAHDVTEKAKALEALRQSEEKYRLLVENSNDGIFIAQDKVTKFPNPMFEKLIGYTAEELETVPFINFIHPDDAEMVIDRYTRRLRGEAPPNIYPLRFINKSGKELWVQLSAVAIIWEGRPASMNFVRDITAEKKLEAQFLQTQKMEAIATLAGGMAHDFNNLLSIIIGNLSLICDDRVRNSKFSKYITNAKEACERAAELTRQLITFSKGGMPITSVGSIARIIQDIINGFHQSADPPVITATIPDDLWAVQINEAEIKQAFLHIVCNAVEFTRKPALIEIRAQNLQISENSNSPLSKGKYIQIDIKDQGIGIPREHLNRIFDPYFSTKPLGTQKGMGLGLAISRSIIEKHNGIITVESEPDVGSVFHVYLPAQETEILLFPQTNKSSAYGKKVLVMDNEALSRELIGNMLSRLEYHAEFAMNGDEAILRYKDAMDSKKPFDVVILDLNLKDGIAGKKTIQNLLEIDPYVNVIISTSYSIDALMPEFKNYGFMKVLPKPYTKKELLAALCKK